MGDSRAKKLEGIRHLMDDTLDKAIADESVPLASIVKEMRIMVAEIIKISNGCKTVSVAFYDEEDGSVRADAIALAGELVAFEILKG